MIQTQPEWNYAVIRVRNADVSAGFYKEFVGMESVTDVRDNKGTRRVQMRQGPQTASPVLVLEETPPPAKGESAPKLYATIGLRLSKREEVDRVAAMAARKDCLTAQPYDGGPFRGYACTVTDPDGNHLEFFCPFTDRLGQVT